MPILRLTHVLLLLSVVVARAAVASPAEQYAAALVDWAAVLEQHVDDKGRVGFSALAADPAPLRRYVEAVAGYGPASAPGDFTDPDAVLAYHINTYNALAMYGVIDRGIPEGFLNFFQRTSFFRLRAVVIDGEETSLHAYENEVIRPLGEPRIHFAVNCMVKDCPRLPQRPFVAATLDKDLERATREFFTHPRKLEIDHASETIRVSAILDFYTEDFAASGRARDLPAYINRYIDSPLPAGYKIKFFDYDWRINAQP
ncbi:MAG: DUF547 domain-containing protein [Halioglobus sp.]|nr:DUF547 domain-containing protein [Halioglobus sp.]